MVWSHLLQYEVCHWIDKKKAEEWTILHRLMFGSRGKNTEIKKHIRLFSGFPDPSVEEKRALLLDKIFLPQLKELANYLDIEVSGAKSDYTQAIMEWLKSPSASGSDGPRGLQKGRGQTKKPTKKKKVSKKASVKKAAGRRTKIMYEPNPPPSAFILFARSIKDEIKKANKNADSATLLKLSKDRFHELDEDESQVWVKKVNH